MSPEQLLGSVDFQDQVVVADFEAGIGTLTRMGDDRLVDVILVVVEPTVKSIEVGTRAVAVASEKGLGRVIVVANRIRDGAASLSIAEAFGGVEVVEVPDDDALAEAERRGVAPLDAAPDSPAVRALMALAGSLAPA
ncbi:MAG: hypothetical protein ACLGHT_11850 [Acidimicrobiia bacterium]